MKKVSAVLTKLISKGKADIYPIAVSGGNIYSVGFNALDDTLYFVYLRICIESLLLCNFRLRGWLIKPILRIECFFSMSYKYLGLINISESCGRKQALEMSFPDWSISSW
jgi:hypothetical protein